MNENYPYPYQQKDENFEYGLKICKKFFEVNNLQFPKVKIKNTLSCYGQTIYNSETVYVNLKRARSPVGNPGFSWSFTGYKADLTPSGILAHECGHIVDSLTNFKLHKQQLNGEPKVTSYEPNKYERSAEMIKVFILNPDLLKIGRPQRYKLLTEVLKLKPVINDNWESVLENAHEKLRKAAQTWIRAAKI